MLDIEAGVRGHEVVDAITFNGRNVCDGPQHGSKRKVMLVEVERGVVLSKHKDAVGIDSGKGAYVPVVTGREWDRRLGLNREAYVGDPLIAKQSKVRDVFLYVSQYALEMLHDGELVDCVFVPE